MSYFQVFFRSAMMAVPFASMAAAIVQWVREDRRSMIDLLAGTAVVYEWDARQFLFSEETVKEEEDDTSDIEEILHDLEEERQVRVQRRMVRQEGRRQIRQGSIRLRSSAISANGAEQKKTATTFFECDEQNPSDLGV